MIDDVKNGKYVYQTGTLPNPDGSPRTLQVSPGMRLYLVSVVATPGGAGATLQLGDRPAIPIAAGRVFTIAGDDTPDAWHGPLNVIIAGATESWFVSWGTPQCDPYPDPNCGTP